MKDAIVICTRQHPSNRFVILDVSAYVECVNLLKLTDKPLPPSFTELTIEGCENCKIEEKWRVIDVKL